jgi:hypothetical protein
MVERRAENQMSLDALQKHVDTRLNAQDTALASITNKLDGHITYAKEELGKVKPVVEAMETMQTGIKVIGWIGSKATAIATLVTGIFAAILAWKGYFK